jgi:outer membrane protein OmpA-like peptidoglycan-associated protein
VNFEAGSARLDAASRRRMTHALPELRRASVLRIAGRTDDVGDQALNDKLANARVLSVLHWIRDPLHAIAAKWSATSQGLCCYVEPNRTPEGRAANRRVEILMTFDPGERIALEVRPGKG